MARLQLLEVLRRETRSQHAALEQSAPMVALLRDDVTLENYRQVLAAMRMLYDPLERGLLPALKEMQLSYGALPYEYVARVALLDGDLEACGVPQGDHSCSVPPMDLNAEQAIGVLYVLEGSTRGGRVIAPHIEQVLGLDAGRGLAMFTLYRHHQGWQGYCRWLADVHLSSVSTTVEAARLVFESLLLKLQTPCVGMQDE